MHEKKLLCAALTDRGVHAVRNAVMVQIPLQYGILDERKSTLIPEWNSIADQCNPRAMEFLDFHSVSPGFCARRNVSCR
ncbi:unnamed protein product [Toxocara canis]|uniref:Uncharacterized protein n=1 Tax=Toxocara canis TaxID=6265 RepID=A0A183U8W5_TOXCA|nr:unnamed protein product [Toxocara canis]